MNVIVIGAGVAGLASAWELARRGCDVTVLERDQPGAGASTAAAGMLAPVAEARFGERHLASLGLESAALWPQFVAELEAASGETLDYRTEGTLVVAVDRDDLAALEHTHRLHLEMGLDARMLDGDEARAIEPMLAPGVPGAVHCAADHNVDPRRLVRALAIAVERAGGRLETGVDVRGLRTEGELVVGLDGFDGDVAPDTVVLVAAGAWTRRLEGLGQDRPHVRPVRGQMLSVGLGEPALCRHVIRTPRGYMVPKSDGRLIIGSTMEEVGFDARLTAGGVMDLLVHAWEALPAIYDQPLLDTWTGFRPLSLDAEPILRRSASLRNVVFATGHGRNGILLTPLTAARMGQLLLD